MDPVSNQQYAHDFQKFVLQDPNVQQVNYQAVPKPFNVDSPNKADKSKKDQKKQQKQKKSKKEDLQKPFT